MLTERFTGTFLGIDGFKPFPKADDRSSWEGLDRSLITGLIRAGEDFLGYEWPLVRATDYLEYIETGNRSKHAKRYFGRRFAVGSLALAACAEGTDRFYKDLIDGLWLICEETSWVIPAHESGASRCPGPLPSNQYTDQGIDLFAAETGALLSWVWYLLGDLLRLSYPEICDRIRFEVKNRILDQFLARDDLWWMGLEPYRKRYLNNWTPWCSSNCLTAFLLIEEEDDRRSQGVEKVLACLDRYLREYPADGGCDEGPGYWVAAAGALCDALELLRLGKVVDAFDENLVREMGKYLPRVHISEKWFVNFADGGPRLNPPPELLYRYGCRIDDGRLRDLGLELFDEKVAALPAARWYPAFRSLSYLFSFAEMKKARKEMVQLTCNGEEETPYDLQRGLFQYTWLPDTEVFVCRHGELFLAAKGGHNGESHNHNDVGQFVVFSGGCPFIIDVGVGEYTRKTFSSERYDIWTMQSAYHNLPQVAGFDQLPGENKSALGAEVNASDTQVSFSLELQDTYPAESGIAKWNRTVALEAGRLDMDAGVPRVILSDHFRFDKAGKTVTLFLMTPWQPVLREGDASGFMLETPDKGSLFIDIPAEMSLAWERIAIDDERLFPVWGEAVYRITLKLTITGIAGGWDIAFTPIQ